MTDHKQELIGRELTNKHSGNVGIVARVRFNTELHQWDYYVSIGDTPNDLTTMIYNKSEILELYGETL